MSFKRKESPLTAGAVGAAVGLALIGGIVLLTQLPANAQKASNPVASASAEFDRPIGFSYGQETQAYDANTRDPNGNRLILDGRIMTGMDASTFSSSTASAQAWSQSSAGAGFSGGATQATSIGNQLNVITTGNYNTVIVNSTQINNGDQSTVLNGKVDLND